MASDHLAASEVRRDDVSYEVGSIRFTDPYRWLEDDTAEVLAWQGREDADTVAYLHALGFFGGLSDAMERGAAAMRVWAPRHHGEYWFRLEAPDADAPTRLVVAANPTGLGRVLVDPAAVDPASPPTLDWYWPSCDGSLVAFGLSAAGSEQSVLHVVRTADGALLPERIPNTFGSTVSWLPDSSGFYYSGFAAPERAAALCYFHRVGASEPAEPEPLANDDVLLAPQVSPDGRWVAVYIGREGRPAYLKNLVDGEWQTFLPASPGFYRGEFAGDELICATTDGSPRGRVVAIPLATVHDRSTWRELIPESEAVLLQIAIAGERIVLGETVDARARLRLTGLDGSPQGQVPLPGEGVVSVDPRASSNGLMFFAGEAEITFLYHSLTVSPAAFRYNIASSRLEQLTRPALEHPNLTARLGWATSRDGTRIPVEIVHRKDLDVSRAHPAFVHAYGGFSYALLPGYFPHFAAFAESGGVFAIPHCRGGTEYGREWWHAARLLTKKHTFEDLFAGAELLVAEGLTEPGKIAFEGASNGGVLALAAVNQRPDLWACAVSMVPLSDLIRVDRDGTEPWTGKVSHVEYGNPEDPEQGPYLLSWSPYHDVREGSPYPAVLVCSGESDIRCPVWHARKWVARARNATSSDNPIRLRVYPAMGHGTGLTIRCQSEWLAEWMGFVFDHLGLEPVGLLRDQEAHG